MSECSVDVKIGMEGSQSKELYKSLEIMLQMHQEKLVKMNQEMCNILSKTNTPFIVIEYPQLQIPEVFDFKGKDYDSGFHQTAGRLYQYANPRNKDTIKLIKNVEKEFQKLTKFNNLANLKLSLYDPLGQKSTGLNLLNGARIKGQLQTDQELMGNLVEVMRRISNQFLNSPIMAFLQLLEQLAFKVELERVQLFPQEIQKNIKSWLNFSGWVHRENLGKLTQLKGQVEISFNLPKLLCLKIKGEIAVVAKLLHEFAVVE